MADIRIAGTSTAPTTIVVEQLVDVRGFYWCRSYGPAWFNPQTVRVVWSGPSGAAADAAIASHRARPIFS